MTTSRLANIPILGWIGGLLFATILLAALAAPLTPYEPQALAGFPFLEPSTDHWLGTDDVGHDIFSQLVHGARLSLLIGLLSASIALFIALSVALWGGYYGGVIDAVLMRFVDMMLAFPFLPLVVVLAAFLGRGIGVTVLMIATVLWARPALVLRAQAIKVRRFPHVGAAEAMGALPRQIIRKHMLPDLLPLATAQFVRTANLAIFLEAAMAFLGVGDPNRISWGTMLYFANVSNAMLLDAWLWWIIPVGLALTGTIVGLAYMGHAIEVWSDPRLASARHRFTTRSSAIESTAERLQQQPQESPTLEIDPSAYALLVRNLTVEYDNTDRTRTAAANIPTVQNVSFTVEPGAIVGLVGPSGCGKSTIAMSILQLRQSRARVVAGEILLRGQALHRLDASEMTALRGREIAFVPQNALNALNPVYTILDQLVEVTKLARFKSDAVGRAHQILEQVGIPASRHRAYPHELSGGMRQRVVIGMAIVNEPTLLVADEPTSGLDVITQAAVVDLLLRLRAEMGMAILLISHDRPLVDSVADKVLEMEDGRIRV